jgi:DNA polymerase-3 subunit alpha
MSVLGQYIRSVREAGYSVLPPDINESLEDFSASGDIIRLGLSAVAKVGNSAVKNIIGSRQQEGPFKSFWDFFLKIDARVVNRGVIENLIKSGAFDNLEKNRAKLLNALPSFLEYASKKCNDTNQCSLFDNVEDSDIEPLIEECEDFTDREKLNFEKESMGIYISGHPYDNYYPMIKNHINCAFSELPLWQSGNQQVITAGLLTSYKERYTKKGDPMGVLDFEDSEATVEAVMFPRQWSKYKPMLTAGSLYLIKGQVRQDRGLSILADEIYTEEDFRSFITPHVTITVESEGLEQVFYGDLCRLLGKYPGKYEVLLKLVNSERTVVSLLKSVKVDFNDNLCADIKDFSKGRAYCS